MKSKKEARGHHQRGREVAACNTCGDWIYAAQASYFVSYTPLVLAHVSCPKNLARNPVQDEE